MNVRSPTFRKPKVFKMMSLKCKRCRYKWNYNGKNEYWATCPHCLGKVKVGKCKKVR